MTAFPQVARVIKFGGSLVQSSYFNNWIDAFGGKTQKSTLIIPGGGIFADAVRITQQKLNFSDSTAHTLAINAMIQYGKILLSLQPKLIPIIKLSDMSFDIEYPMLCLSEDLFEDMRIPKTWQCTSDSLSAWMAHKLSAEELLIIKMIVSCEKNVQQLISQQILDACFEDFRQALPSKTKVFLVNQDNYKLNLKNANEVNLNSLA